ncbi:hypothetical protein C8R42DRAFT_728959 [Lentinula raphanica]|nr:hypothetical protein C8R42DRAFT_728959 [Lentinula raphanica]
MDSLRLYPPLPNELLHSIANYIAYTPNISNQRGSRNKSFFKHASPELLALSVVNWRLRRICLPFLLAYIKLRHDKDVKKLENDLSLCAKFTKNLVIGRFGALTQDGERITSRVVPRLEQLLNVELPDCWDRSDLLGIILAHPTVTSVLVNEEPHVSMRAHDLSKVILDYTNSTSAFSPQFTTYFERGMRLKCLGLATDSIDNRLQSHHFPGLEEIKIYMFKADVSFSWLSPLSSTYPTLTRLWLLQIDKDSLTHNAPPFLSSLVVESQRQGLQHVFRILGVGLRRAKPVDQESQDWRVMGLALRTTSAHKLLIETLALVASVFPKLEFLTLDLDRHQETYNIDELASVLARFSSLRVIYLECVYERLNFGPGNENLMRPVQRDGSTHSDSLDELRARAESGLLLFTSRLVKQAKSLDLVHIDDMGYDSAGSTRPAIHWHLRGWLHVLNSNRDIGGTLDNYH